MAKQQYRQVTFCGFCQSNTAPEHRVGRGLNLDWQLIKPKPDPPMRKHDIGLHTKTKGDPKVPFFQSRMN
tara:strand:- start:45167 stop:45376 length:210 start_codon:yes stop_codon:yes gene_type:complete